MFYTNGIHNDQNHFYFKLKIIYFHSLMDFNLMFNIFNLNMNCQLKLMDIFAIITSNMRLCFR